jgi:(1->4)-alpha-D-glucan 1-alpha-D-glucosylmutase
MSADAEQTPPIDDGRASDLLEAALATLAPERRIPTSTYRLQFHAGFKFTDAGRIVPYLHDLGITDCYASPYLKARPGSKHGYDIVDHRLLNPEIGDDDDFDAWVHALRAHDMGQILDIVPNHMGIVGNENLWWNDVLENGPCSAYAGFFDIDWCPAKAELHGKVLLPVLGNPYGKVLEAGEINLTYESGAFVIHYFTQRFPVSPESSLLCLRHRFDELEAMLAWDSADLMEYQSILTALGHLPPRAEANRRKAEERRREIEVIKRRLATLTESSAVLKEFLRENVELFNGQPGDPRSFDLLDQLLDAQVYRLAFWTVAADEINYRRFFDINDLAALGMEKPEVFAATHELIRCLLAERKVTGLRIDHIDGLYDPRQYLQRLQADFVLDSAQRIWAADGDHREDEWPHLQEQLSSKVGAVSEGPCPFRPLYIVVEKILGRGETLPDDWPAHGTTGYEFLNMVNGLFVEAANEAALSRIYHRYSGMDPAFREYVYRNKLLILRVSLSSELYMLGHQLDRLSERNRWSRDFTQTSLRHALREIIACFPVYRSYITDAVLPRDRFHIELAVNQAKRRNPAISKSIFDFVQEMLLLRYPDSATEADRDEQRRFVGKLQQFTGPAMAKGLEDTAFYVHDRLVSLNEVGGDPGRFGVSPEALNHFFAERQRSWPHALSATATHDTKRGEDARARINVLSEIPAQWRGCVSRWGRANKRFRFKVDDQEAPSRNDEYLLYQTLLGAWPLQDGIGAPRKEFVERICHYMGKAVHEAKVHSSWINPNQPYDAAVRQFVCHILDDKVNGRFLEDFVSFQARISHWGIFNSLAQMLLKIAAPGVPDFYQGTELWDFSLVDPDNRRAVDYDLRLQMLDKLKRQTPQEPGRLAEFALELLHAKEDGRIKLHLIRQALRERRSNPALFAEGEYLPAVVHGSKRENVFAFVRRHAGTCAIAAVPRLITRLTPNPGDVPVGRPVWQDDALQLPPQVSNGPFRNVFTGEVVTPIRNNDQDEMAMADVLSTFPVALLVAVV